MSFVENFRTSPPTRQALLVGAAAVLLSVVLIAAYLVFFNRPYGVLFSNLRTLDAATITADLDKKKIPYRLADQGETILVPRDLVDSTRLAIAGEDLPLKGEVGFELFNKSDMGLTEFAQRINYQRALQGELARTIMTMAPIDTARVHLTLAEPTVFRDDRRPSKASVTVLTRPGWKLPGDTVVGIQRLVAASVPDLAPGDVVVLDGDGKAVGGDAPISPAPASPQAQERSAIEQYYAARLEQALGAVFPGRTQVNVQARADPNPAAIDGASAALDAWTPKARSFPLAVSIAFPAPPSVEVQSQVRALAAQAIDLDPAKGDSLTLATSVAAADGTAPARTQFAPATGAPPPATVAPRPQALPLWGILLFIAAVAAVGAITFWASRRTAPRRLNERERTAFAQRLRALIDEGEEHAAPSV